MDRKTVVLRLHDAGRPDSPTFESKFLVEDIESFDDFKLTLKNGRTFYPVLTKDEIARKLGLSGADGDVEQ
jgi:hypothetical protein